MIPLIQLETGNLVLHKSKFRPFRVTRVSLPKVRLDYPGNTDGPFEVDTEELIPIPLSTKVLLQIGFYPDQASKNLFICKNNESIVVEEDITKTSYHLVQPGKGNYKFSTKELCFVHSLQNEISDKLNTLLVIEDEKIDLKKAGFSQSAFGILSPSEGIVICPEEKFSTIAIKDYPQRCSLHNPIKEAEEKQLKLDKCYLKMAFIWAENSYAKRRKVGSLIVKDKMIISDGYNGTPSGFDNCCEDENNTTFPYVLHAESNAITKLAKSGNASSYGATIYITDEPCKDCAKLIIQAGIIRVVYCRGYRDHSGIELLAKANIRVDKVELEDAPEVPCP